MKTRTIIFKSDSPYLLLLIIYIILINNISFFIYERLKPAWLRHSFWEQVCNLEPEVFELELEVLKSESEVCNLEFLLPLEEVCNLEPEVFELEFLKIRSVQNGVSNKNAGFYLHFFCKKLIL